MTWIPQTTSKLSPCRSMQLTAAPPKTPWERSCFKLHQADLLNAERTFSRAWGSAIRPPETPDGAKAKKKPSHQPTTVSHACDQLGHAAVDARSKMTVLDDWFMVQVGRDSIVPELQEGQESTLLALNRSTCRRRSTKGTRRSKSDPVILSRWRYDVRAISPLQTPIWDPSPAKSLAEK